MLPLEIHQVAGLRHQELIDFAPERRSVVRGPWPLVRLLKAMPRLCWPTSSPFRIIEATPARNAPD